MSSVSAEMADFDRWLAEHNMEGYWHNDFQPAAFTPHVWKWAEIHEAVVTATRVVPMEETERRTIRMRHPNLGDRMTNTIHMAVQCVLPGEFARAHRHNMAAIRFVLQGNPDAATVVEGEPIPMGEGDFITTPNWTVHDHYNHGSEPVIWLDGLDARLATIGKVLVEGVGTDQQSILRPAGTTLKTSGHTRPSWVKIEHATPPFHYPWAETYATLLSLKESEDPGDPYDGLQLSYSHPLTGGPTLPTFACEIQLLIPGLKTRTHRHVSTTAFHVVRGEGVTEVDGRYLEWGTGDIFVVPPWTWHHHENRGADDAVLFTMDDWPALTALGFYREEGAE